MPRLPRFGAAAALALLFGLAAVAADPPKNDAGPKRVTYIVKHATAGGLAAVLADHFKGSAEIQALPDPASNCLLISGPPAAVDEVVKALGQLDRAPQTVTVDVIIATAAKKADGDKAAPAGEVDEKEFSGPIADVEAKVEALQKKGVLADVKRLQLLAVEGRPESVTLGESLPYVTGVNRMATGITSRMISYRNAGLKADATARVSAEKVVSLDLKLEESHPYVPADGIAIGTDENNKPIFATDFAMTTVTSQVEIPSGRAQVVEGVKTSAKSDKPHVLVIVGARVAEPDARPDK